MYEIYDVVEGDNLEKIADKFDTTVDNIMNLNGFNKNLELTSNMQIIVPKKEASNYWYYTVKKGDNLYQIAKEYDVDYRVILAINGLEDGDYIYPNQTLLLPGEKVKIYLTGNNDTIRDVLERNDILIDDFVKDNENIYLRSEQIITFRKKWLFISFFLLYNCFIIE